MNEKLKTLAFLILAALLAFTAWMVTPTRTTPEVFSDQGEAFYPDFEPGATASVEIVRYEADKDEVRHFLVEFRNKHWTIPSHENYPADAEKQLGKVVSVVNGLKKGVVRPGDPSDFGTLSPLDTETTDGKRGTLVTLKDATGKVLSKLIVGDAVEGKSGYRFVRNPDSKRTYACKIDATGLSTRFSDWVETDLLKLDKGDIETVVIDNYRVDERNAQKVETEMLTLAQKDGAWALDGLGEKEELVTDKVSTLTSTLDSLKLVGVRRKPEGLVKAVEKLEAGQTLTPQEGAQLRTLSSKGYYFGQMPGSETVTMVSNDGEVRVACDDGITYRLLFGEVLYGDADDVSGASDDEAKDGEKAEGKEHRYLFVRAAFDQSLLGDKPTEPKKPEAPAKAEEKKDEKAEGDARKDEGDAKKDEESPEQKAQKEYERALETYKSDVKAYEKKIADGKKRAEELQERFAAWYYVIDADAFGKLHLSRKDLVKEKKEEKKDEAKADGNTPAPSDDTK